MLRILWTWPNFERAITAANQAKEAGSASDFREALAAAVTFYTGDLLPGCYDDWILSERERLRQEYLGALAQIIELLQDQGDNRTAISYAQRLLREDPLSEEGYRRLMQLYAQNGDRARALRTYHSCVTTLQRELGVEPGPATRQAHEQLLNLVTPHPPQPQPQPASVGIAPLVGRQMEWQTLQACWRLSAAGRSHFVTVAGEAGIGKTRLIEELVDWATRQGVVTAHTRSYASEGGLTYAPLTGWLRTAALKTELQHLDDVWLTEIARLLPELLDRAA